jgi:hypothetical protein
MKIAKSIAVPTLAGSLAIALIAAAALWTAPPATAQTESPTVRLFTGGSRVSRPSMVVSYNNLMLTARLQETIAVGDKREPINTLHNINTSFTVTLRRRDGREEGLARAAEVAEGLEPIVRAEVLASIKPGSYLSDASLATLPDELRSEAESSFRKEFSGWENSHQFDIEVLLTQFHLTDLSVGAR